MRNTRTKRLLCATIISIGACCCFVFVRSGRAAPNEAEEAWKWPGSAMQTWRKYVSSKRMESAYIPLSCWAEPIRKLDPLYVYHHRANIVVVLKRKDDQEEGAYISNPVSSFAIVKGEEADGFSFRETDDQGYYRFVRRRSTNKGIDAKLIVGIWEVVSHQFNGQRVKAAPDTRYMFSESGLRIERKEQMVETKRYTVDSNQSPKRINFSHQQEMPGPLRTDGLHETRYLEIFSAGIFEVEADTLRLCFGLPVPSKTTPHLRCVKSKRDTGQVGVDSRKNERRNDRGRLPSRWPNSAPVRILF